MTARTVGLAWAAALAVGCKGGGKPPEQQPPAAPAAQQAAMPADVELAAAVARAIDAAPTKVDSILTAHGLTRAGLDSLMYAIAADSAKSAAYSAARRQQ